MSDISIRTLILQFVDTNGANHIREMHIEILRQKPGTPEHTIRARLSEAVTDGFLNRLGEGFYDVYAWMLLRCRTALLRSQAEGTPSAAMRDQVNRARAVQVARGPVM